MQALPWKRILIFLYTSYLRFSQTFCWKSLTFFREISQKISFRQIKKFTFAVTLVFLSIPTYSYICYVQYFCGGGEHIETSAKYFPSDMLYIPYIYHIYIPGYIQYTIYILYIYCIPGLTIMTCRPNGTPSCNNQPTVLTICTNKLRYVRQQFLLNNNNWFEELFTVLNNCCLIPFIIFCLLHFTNFVLLPFNNFVFCLILSAASSL